MTTQPPLSLPSIQPPEDRIHILYVDDSKFDRGLVRHVLEQEHGGFSIREAASQAEFEQRLSEGSYDLVLTDFNILGFEGFQVLDAVHARDSLLPVVIVTGTGSEEVAVEAMKRGVADYVIKTPSHIQRLPHTIETALERVYLQIELQKATQELKTRARQQAAVAELGQQALGGKALSVLTQNAAVYLTQILNVPFCFVMEYMEEDNTLHPLAMVGLQNDLGQHPLPVESAPIFQDTLQSNSPIVFTLSPEDTLPRLPDLFEPHGIVGGVCLTIPFKDFPLGLLGVCATEERSYSDDDLHFVQSIANVLATATERKRAEGLLRHNEARYRSLFENAQDIIFTLSLKGTITSLNPAFESVTGLNRTDWIGRSFMDLIHPNHLPKAKRILQLIRNEQQSVFEFEFRNVEGTYLVGEFTAQINNIGTPRAGIIGIGRDITRRKQYETSLIESKKRAEEMSRLKSAFLTNMSHEFRTPLTGIIGFASLLASEVTPEHLEFLKLIECNGKRLLNTLNAILDLSMIESGSLETNRVRCDVVELVQEKVDLLRLETEEKGLHLHVRVSDANLTLKTDPALLDRILNNLIGNAIKFTRNGRIDIQLSKSVDHVRLAIKDTGVGISPNFLPYLFDEFKQESMGITRPYEGAGLGLTITKQLVEMLEGTIRVESNKGVGSTFILHFPLSESAHPTPTYHDKRCR